MAYNPNNPNGPTGSANSAPVVIASDQSTINTALQEVSTGGASVFHLVTGATTNQRNIKNSAGKVTGWYIYNSNGSPRKVAFHDTAGTPAAGSSVYFSIVIPAISGANCPYPAGINFSNGIAISTTTGLPDSDASAVAANDLIINIFYK
jgi:hypothetical protein